MQNELFQSLFLWESLSLPVITLDGDIILYRNEWAALRFPSAVEGSDIRTFLGEIGYRKLKTCGAGDDLTLLLDGISYDAVVVPSETHRHLIFVGSRREYRFTGYHELALLVPSLQESLTNLLACAAMADGASASIRGMLLRNICRTLRSADTLRYLTELRTDEIPLTPTMTDLSALLSELSALWRVNETLPALKTDASDAFSVFFDRKSIVTILCRLLSLAAARCTAADTVTIAVTQADDAFAVTVTDTGRPYEAGTISAMNCTEAFSAAECGLPADAALDAGVVWLLVSSLGGNVRCDKNTVTATLPCAPNIVPTPDRPAMQMEFSAGAGIDPIKTELSPLLPSALYENR